MNSEVDINCDPYEVVKITRAEKTSWAMNKVMVSENMVTMVSQVDATNLQNIRDQANQKNQSPPSYTALVIRAAALTIKNNPQANRAILGPPFFRRLFQFNNFDISVAVEKSLPGMPGQAFAAPITNALDKSANQISLELQKLANCDESNNENFRIFMRILKFVPRPLSLWLIHSPLWFPRLWIKYRGSACWVNAPSKSGVDVVATTWPWPVSFSFGMVKKRPVVVDDRVQAVLTMPVVMVFDRRIMGGGPAGRIFAQFKEFLETANQL